MTTPDAISYTVPYVEGDGVGPQLINYARDIADKVMQKCYSGERTIEWQALLCGEKAAEVYQGDWFPEQTLNMIELRQCALIGPITAPIGYGFKSLNVALRHELGLTTSYTRYQTDSESDIYVIRDNSEDLPVKLEWQTDSFDGELLANFLKDELGVNKIPLAEKSVMALKYLSKARSEKLLSSAIELAKSRKIKNVVIIHHANSLPISEGSFVRWALASVSNKEDGQQNVTPPIHLDNIQVDVCSLLQFFSHQHHLKQDTIYVCANYLATIINEFFTGSLGLINKVSQTNFGNNIRIFEPKHGPLHGLVGSDEITPIALLNAIISLLYHLDCDLAARTLAKAVFEVEKSLKDKAISFKQFQETLELSLCR